jgi:hypothetical protein
MAGILPAMSKPLEELSVTTLRRRLRATVESIGDDSQVARVLRRLIAEKSKKRPALKPAGTSPTARKEPHAGSS